MRKRVKIALLVVLLAAVGLVGWRAAQPSEPVYRGKNLTDWLDSFRGTASYFPPEDPDCVELRPLDPSETGKEARRQACAALEEAGTNAVPTVLRLLRMKDSPLKLKLIALLQRQHIVQVRYKSAESWHVAAGSAFDYPALTSDVREAAVPGLIEIAEENISSSSRCLAIGALGCVGPEAKGAVPLLLKLLATERDRTVLHVVTNALVSIDPEGADKAGATNRLHRVGGP